MAAGLYSFIIEQGSTIEKVFSYKDQAGNPIDLTGYTGRMQIRDVPGGSSLYASLTTNILSDGTGISFTPSINGVVQPATSGSIKVTISAATSSLFSFNEAHYDLELVTLDGSTEIVTKLLRGKVKLTREVTI